MTLMARQRLERAKERILYTDPERYDYKKSQHYRTN